MSDYLWDKTGEPEEDVAQLENLLGTLKYRPRPLEIPATAMPTVSATAASTTAARPRPATIFARPRLALAASLILTLLAGGWFVLRQDQPQPLAKVEQESGTGEGRRAEPIVVPPVEIDRSAPSNNLRPSQPRRDKAAKSAAVAPEIRRPSRQLIARRQKFAGRAGEQSPAPREEVAAQGATGWQVEQPLTPQQREATEQLMLALRLASAKLNYAQREMQEIGRAGK